MAQYLIANYAMPTTAAPTPVTTGTAIKTMLQVKPSATAGCKIKAWGYSFDSSAAATSAKIELLQTDVAATVTAHSATGIMKYDAMALIGGDPTTNLIQVGTTATGFTSTSEGSITDVRVLASPRFETTSTSFAVNWSESFPLGLEPRVQPDKFARIRVTFGTAVNMYCWMLIEI